MPAHARLADAPKTFLASRPWPRTAPAGRDAVSDATAFLAGSGEAARLILGRDWSVHPLGHPGTWPQALKTALSLVLNSPESMILAWGPDLHVFINDT
jgi:hypothetical protein